MHLALGGLYHFAWKDYIILLGRIIPLYQGGLYRLPGKIIPLYFRGLYHFTWEDYITLLRRIILLLLGDLYHFSWAIYTSLLEFMIIAGADNRPPMLEKSMYDSWKSRLAVYVFTQGDDLSACLNRAMGFLSDVAASRFPSTNNQLRTSSNPRNQALFKTARHCTQLKRPRNAAWLRDKAMLSEAQESGQILDEEQLAFLRDLGIPEGQAAQTTILNNTDVISEVPHSKPYHNDMDNQSVHAMQDFKQTAVVNFLNNEITSDSNIISYSQYLQETQQAVVQDTNFYAQQDSMILSVIEQMSKQMINHVNMGKGLQGVTAIQLVQLKDYYCLWRFNCQMDKDV
nr:hypothetical protein [Tanacetum cinerariifolium]